MNFLDIVQAQLVDPFRIGLLIALIFTTRRTATNTGNVLPLLLGAAFVAVLIPTAMGGESADKASTIGAGLISNAILLAVLLAALALWSRISGRDSN